jgi:predicted permease
VDTLFQDLRYAVRTLLRSPGFTAVAVLTLGLGIGANTAVFTLVNAALFRAPPGARPHELVWLGATRDFPQQPGRPRSYQRRFSLPEYRDYAAGATAFTGLSAYQDVALALGSGGEPERINGMLVSGNYFQVLGLVPAAGRFFAPEEDRDPGAHAVVVLSHGLWRRRFGSDPATVGTDITINGRRFMVAGVAPAGFVGIQLGEPAELFMPLAMVGVAMPRSAELLDQRYAGWLQIVGRLKPGVTAAAAGTEVATLAARLAQEYPEALEGASAEVTPLSGGLDPGNRQEALPIFVLLMAVPVVVLLIACANVANLLLARATGRRREIGIRLALGATRSRLLRQLLTESVLLALCAGAAGMLLSFWLNDVLLAVSRAPAEIELALKPDMRVLAFTIVVAVVTGVLFGLAPALGATRPDVVPALKEEGIALGRRVRRSRLTGAFVVAQVALSLILLVTAGLFLRSLDKALGVNPGFDPVNRMSLSFDLGIQGYSDRQRGTFYARLLERVRALPGVEAASLASPLPLSGRIIATAVSLEGVDPDAGAVPVTLGSISPEYFATLGVPLVQGRDFAPADGPGAPLVVIVNETLARRLWPDQDPVGRRLRLYGREEPLREVIGVAKDGKYDELTERPRSFLYFPERQHADLSDISLVVRTTGDPRPLAGALTAAVHELDPTLPIFRLETLEQSLVNRLDKERGASSLLGVFGTLALLLAALGLYGVMAYAVSQRTREIGIRVALGARQADVLRQFVGEGVRLAVVGVVIGLVLSVALTRVIAQFLYGVTATDVATFAAGALVLCVVAVAASWLPARRAARVDPMVALRAE